MNDIYDEKTPKGFRVQVIEERCANCRFSYLREKWQGWETWECHKDMSQNIIYDVDADGICPCFQKSR